MAQITESKDLIVFEEKHSVPMRIFFFFCGLLAFLLPTYELLIKPQWFRHYHISQLLTSPFFIFPLLIVVGCGLLFVFCVVLTFLGLNRKFLFDFHGKTLHYTFSAPLVKLRQEQYRHSEVKDITVVREVELEGADTYNIVLTIKTKRYSFGGFESPAEAQKYKAKLDAWMAQ